MSNKTKGSALFGTSFITTEEYILMGKVKKAAGASTEEIAIEIEAMDDIISLMRSEAIIRARRFTPTGRIRKDSALGDLINNRIDLMIDELNGIG